MTILLNGETRQIESARDITALVAELGMPSRSVLIEHNGLALRRDEWGERALSEGDRVEIIQIVAGG